MDTPLRAVIHNGKIEPMQPVQLPEGTHVVVVPVPEDQGGQAEAESGPSRQRTLGTLSGTVEFVAPDFDAPLDDFKDHMA